MSLMAVRVSGGDSVLPDWLFVSRFILRWGDLLAQGFKVVSR